MAGKYNFVWDAKTQSDDRKMTEPMATLSKGAIRLNALAAERLRHAEKVALAVDPVNRLIAIKGYRSDDNLKPYNFGFKDGLASIRCRAFMDRVTADLKLDFDAVPKRECSVTYNPKTRMLIIDVLAKPAQAE